MQNYARIGIFGILALVGLRIGIGWHFYMEGVSKVRGNSFSSEGFLLSARGPLAPKFQNMIWDYSGHFRLNEERIPVYFDAYADSLKKHFAMTEDQARRVDRVAKQYIDKLGDVYAENSEEIYKYLESEQRLEKMRESKMWNEVTSLSEQQQKIRTDLRKEVAPALASIDAIWKQFEQRLNGLASPEQYRSAGYFYFARPGEGLLSSSVVDRIIPIFDMSVGILLMLGLLTPLAAWLGALFLIGVVLSQMPGYTGTQPTYFQAVECLALVVLATTDAGRYAGLDFIPWSWWQNRKAAHATAPAA